VHPYIARFTDIEEKVRRNNVIAKQKLASSAKPYQKDLKKSLPPKSPFTVSEYLKNSTRSYAEQNERKSTTNSYAKRGV
jgi:hypothetical protein